jgi:hypothetical protein
MPRCTGVQADSVYKGGNPALSANGLPGTSTLGVLGGWFNKLGRNR